MRRLQILVAFLGGFGRFPLLELRFVAHGEHLRFGVTNTEKVSIVFVKGTNRVCAGSKAKLLIKFRISQDKECAGLDSLLP